VVMAA
jgi:hypothetical protein